MKLNTLVLAAAVGLFGSVAPLLAQTFTDEEFARITAGVDAFLDQLVELDRFSPGHVITIATSDGRRYIRTDGVLNAELRQPAEADSEFYIASMTKAYMGLLAVRLDAEGILSLDTTIADAWPNLQMPEGVDPSAITMRILLSHQLGFEAGEITGIEANVRDIPASEYPVLLERYAVATEPGFSYDNLGYNIYAAILEQVTGRNWRDWLQDDIFGPLGMTGTSGRVSDFAPESVAWGHQPDVGLLPFWPSADGWFLIPPKTDGMMQSAGGLMTTGEDFATWIEANLRQEAPGFTAEMFETAQQTWVEQEADGDGFSCAGYSFGWNTCEYLHLGTATDGSTLPLVNVLQHGGGYTGYGSLITLVPDMGIGVAIAHNVQGPQNYLDLEISKLVLELVLALDSIDDRNATRVERFASIGQRMATFLQTRVEEQMADEMWGEGEWDPDGAFLSSLAGSYHNDDYFIHDFTLSYVGASLMLTSDGLTRRIQPISPDIFGAYADPFSPPELFQLIRDESGAITSIDWDGELYVPVSE